MPRRPLGARPMTSAERKRLQRKRDRDAEALETAGAATDPQLALEQLDQADSEAEGARKLDQAHRAAVNTIAAARRPRESEPTGGAGWCPAHTTRPCRPSTPTLIGSTVVEDREGHRT